MRLFQLLPIFVCAAAVHGGSPCQYVTDYYCYWFVPGGSLNADAQRNCASQGGRLAAVKNEAQYNEMNNFLNSVIQTNDGIWYGLWNYEPHSQNNPGQWRIDNGTGAPGYTKWQPGDRPDDAYGGIEKCVEVVINSGMNDIPCNGWGLAGYICQSLWQ